MKVYSFDVFDTCITRLCGEPDNVFWLLAEAVLDDANESLYRGFVRERKMAEKKAICALRKDAVTIDEIYSFFELSFFTTKHKEFVRDLEIGIEEKLFVPIKTTIDRINTLRGKGSIVFISDMYLPSAMLRDALQRLGIMQSDDILYISGSVGLSKRSGKLFDYVKEKEHILVKDWIHFGDNIDSDYLVPKSKGIKAVLLQTGYSPYELTCLHEYRFTHVPFSISFFAGLIRAFRFSQDLTIENKFNIDIVAPLFIPYVVSILNDAASKGINRIYFASRDAYIIYCIAKQFSSQFPQLECHYLHISRTVLYPILIESNPEKELLYLLGLNSEFIPRKLIHVLGFGDDEILDLNDEMNLDTKMSIKNFDLSHFVNVLLSRGRKNLLLQRARERRCLLEKYLIQEKFYSQCDEDVALVDIGWRCSSQAILSKVFKRNVHYYYWGVTDERLAIQQTGKFKSSIYWEDFYAPKYINPYSRVRKIIEYYVCSNSEGTTIGYRIESNGEIVPVLANSVNEDKEIVIMREQLMKIARSYSQYPFLLHDADLIFKTCSLKVLDEFSNYPSKDICKFFSQKTWNDSLISNEEIPFVLKLYPWTFVYLLWIFVLKMFHMNVSSKYKWIWFDASLIYTYGFIGKWLVKMEYSLFHSRSIRQKVRMLCYWIGIKY